MSLFSKTREDLHAVVTEHAQLLEQVKEMNTVALTSSNISDQIRRKKESVAKKEVQLVDQFGNEIDNKSHIRPQGSTTPDLNYAYIGAYGAGGGGRPKPIRQPSQGSGGGGANRSSRTKASKEYGLAGRMLEKLGLPVESIYVIAWNRAYLANNQGFNFPTVEEVEEEYDFLSYHPEMLANLPREYPSVRSGAGGSSGSGSRSIGNNSSQNTGYQTNQIPQSRSSGSGKSFQYVAEAVARSGGQIVGALTRIERELKTNPSSDFRRILGQ